MKKILLFLLIAQSTFSQTITFIEKNDTLQRPEYQEFIYLNEVTDSNPSKFVATIKSEGSLKKPSLLFEKIKDAAQNLGANSFKYVSFKMNDTESGELVLKAYFSADSLLTANFKNIPKNKVYVYGDENMLGNKIQGYKVDGKKMEIGAGKFKVYDVAIGESLKINKGGFTGLTLWIEGKEDKGASFLSFSGIGLADTQYIPGQPGIGVSINTGKIHRIEPNMALLFLHIFEEQQ